MDSKAKSPHPSGIPVPRRIRRSASQPIPPRMSRKDQFNGQLTDHSDQSWDSGSVEGKGAISPSGARLDNTEKRLFQSVDGLGRTNSRKGRGSESPVLRQSRSCDKLTKRQLPGSFDASDENQVSNNLSYNVRFYLLSIVKCCCIIKTYSFIIA